MEKIKEAETETISCKKGILFTRDCVIKGTLYARGPIIALGNLKADKVVSDVFIAIEGPLSVKSLISACLILARDIKCKGWIVTPTIPSFSSSSYASSWMT